MDVGLGLTVPDENETHNSILSLWPALSSLCGAVCYPSVELGVASARSVSRRFFVGLIGIGLVGIGLIGKAASAEEAQRDQNGSD